MSHLRAKPNLASKRQQKNVISFNTFSSHARNCAIDDIFSCHEAMSWLVYRESISDRHFATLPSRWIGLRQARIQFSFRGVKAVNYLRLRGREAVTHPITEFWHQLIFLTGACSKHWYRKIRNGRETNGIVVKKWLYDRQWLQRKRPFNWDMFSPDQKTSSAWPVICWQIANVSSCVWVLDSLMSNDAAATRIYIVNQLGLKIRCFERQMAFEFLP